MNTRDIDYVLERKARKTLEISVLPDGKVLVKAPADASDESIQGFVARRAAWVRKQIKYFMDFEPRLQPRHFVPGEAHLFLGKRYRLRILSGAPTTSIEGDFLVVRTRERSPAQVERIIESWQRKQAKVVFAELVTKVWPRFGLPIEERPRICVKALTRRWGSLSASGTLTMNLALIQASRPCIEYVICHELCHIEHPGHGAAFYKKLEKVLPDWKDRKLRLERMLC
jgi:predicted metal-dependent hydrolase